MSVTSRRAPSVLPSAFQTSQNEERSQDPILWAFGVAELSRTKCHRSDPILGQALGVEWMTWSNKRPGKIPGNVFEEMLFAPAWMETKENVCGSIDQALKLSIERSSFCIFPAFYNANVSSSISTNIGPFHFLICHLPYREKVASWFSFWRASSYRSSRLSTKVANQLFIPRCRFECDFFAFHITVKWSNWISLPRLRFNFEKLHFI